MTKVDVFSGFLGAGKTTLIKKLIAEAYAGEKLVLIENEFGEIGVDGGFMKDAGIEVTEMNSGCICCSLTGDFRAALHEVCERYAPDRILIEPSGVGKLSDIVTAVEQASDGELTINALCTVVDAGKCKMYMRNFGEFFNNQVESAGCIILSRTAGIKEEKLAECVALLREKNPGAVIITTPWDELSGAQILDAMEKRDTLTAALESIEREHEEDEDEHEHHHHHDHEHEEHEHHHHFDENGNCSCGCHHDDDEDDDGHEHEHHHHDHDEHDHEHECGCGHDHEHHHHDHDEHDHDHGCGCGHHHHHHGHDADEVFTSWGMETAKKFTEDGLRAALTALEDEAKYGAVLRAKGIVAASEGEWIHFDYTPGEINIRRGSAGVTGRLCVIGHELHEDAVAGLFR
ncbi:MAG TPA: cobalamin biosynthesis protein CobW [Clostridiales bacterium]|nr:cobalamin biosynthesis protein CobW [Clostridiales bacterium]